MEILQNLDKSLVREFCRIHKLDVAGSKRQLLQRIVDANFHNDEIEAFVEDVEEERQKEQEKLQKEQEERQKKQEKRHYERELRQHELEMETIRARARSGTGYSEGNINPNGNGICKIKISNYMSPYEVNTDIGMFLTNFERLGEQLDVPREQWATQLIKLLPGEVATVVARMSAGEAADYVKVKENLLARFKLSAEAFRQRFRKARRADNQPYSEYCFLLETNLTEWIEGSGAANNYERLKELIALEKFYQSLPEDLRFWLLDRKPTTLKDACNLADQYEALRGSRHLNGEKDHLHGNKNHSEKFNQKNGRASKPSNTQETEENPTPQAKTGTQNNSSKQLNKQSDLKCYNCSETGHFARHCDKPKVVALCMPDRYKEKATDLLQKYMLPLDVNGHKVSALRDTGATFDVISEKLVSPGDYTGEQASFRQAFDADPVFLPLAKVALKGDFGTLDTIAAVAKNPVVSYIVSNQTAELKEEVAASFNPVLVITRQKSRELSRSLAKAVENPADSRTADTTDVSDDVTPKGASTDRESLPLASGQQDEVSADAFEKQGQPETDKDSDKEKKHFFDKTHVSKLDYVTQQQTDPSLQKLFALSSEPADVDLKQRFMIRDEILDGGGEDKLGCESDQVVVLRSNLEQPMIDLAHSHFLPGHLGINRTKTPVWSEFYYPGIFKDAAHFVKTCETCHKVGHGRNGSKVKLLRVSLILDRFKRSRRSIVGFLERLLQTCLVRFELLLQF